MTGPNKKVIMIVMTRICFTGSSPLELISIDGMDLFASHQDSKCFSLSWQIGVLVLIARVSPNVVPA